MRLLMLADTAADSRQLLQHASLAFPLRCTRVRLSVCPVDRHLPLAAAGTRAADIVIIIIICYATRILQLRQVHVPMCTSDNECAYLNVLE